MTPVQFPVSLVIVGMDISWGGGEGLDSFDRAVYECLTGFSALSAKANTESHAEVACPPDPSSQENSPVSRISAMIEKVTERALADAGILVGTHHNHRIAVVVSVNDRITLRWDWLLAVEDVSLRTNPLVAALEFASRTLEQGNADVVVFAAANYLPASVNGGVETSAIHRTTSTLGFDRTVHDEEQGEGAAAVVLTASGSVEARGKRIYAAIRSLASREGVLVRQEIEAGPAKMSMLPSLEDIRICCRDALQSAEISPAQVGYVEACASGKDALDGVEIAGIVRAYRSASQDLNTALGSVQTVTAHLGPAAGLAALVQASLCLYQRFYPGTPNWHGPKLPALWTNAPFFVPNSSRPWFSPSRGPARLAGLSLVGSSGSYAHVILQEPDRHLFRPNRALSQGGFYLFPLPGDSLADLQNQLTSLNSSLNRFHDLGSLAAVHHEMAQANDRAVFGLVIIGHTHEEVHREIELALKAIPVAYAEGGEWQTPLGSYFTAEPVGMAGEVAFVYPGAFNSYPGVGKDLLRLFPSLYMRMDGLTGDLGGVLHERMLYPRGLNPFTREEVAAQEAQLLADPMAMLISGTTLAVMYTHILQETFGVQAKSAFGYSLGENSMIYAAGVWSTQGDEAAARLKDSAAFNVRLAGPQQAIREYWGIQPSSVESGGALWSNYLVMAPVDKVQETLSKEQRVYLTHINTPRQVVIGGDPQACQRVIGLLQCASLRAPFDYALHCAPMRSEYDALAELHSYPVENATRLRLYSAADDAPLKLDQQEIAQKMAHMLTSPLDFPRLVQKVYSDGARVFIEAGAGSNCTRWIDETLKGKPHLALSMNRRGTDDYHTLVRMAARLFSHRVPLDLSALFQSSMETVTL